MSNENLNASDSQFSNTTNVSCAFENAYNTLCHRVPHFTTADAEDVKNHINSEGQRFCDALGDDVQYLDTITVTDFEVVITCYNLEAEETLYKALKKESFLTVVKMKKGVWLKYEENSFEPEEIKNIIEQDKNHRVIFAFLAAIFETLGCKTIW